LQHRGFDMMPDRFGIDQQTIHVEDYSLGTEGVHSDQQSAFSSQQSAKKVSVAHGGAPTVLFHHRRVVVNR
jgi:hypothetical protein